MKNGGPELGKLTMIHGFAHEQKKQDHHHSQEWVDGLAMPKNTNYRMMLMMGHNRHKTPPALSAGVPTVCNYLAFSANGKKINFRNTLDGAWEGDDIYHSAKICLNQ